MAEDVLVIGAGPAGLASAYWLEQAGISYRVVDKADVVGSTWANLYPSLRLNTSRFYSHLPGDRFPLDFGFFAMGKQYHRYLVNYAEKHNFNIHLGVEVHRVAPEGDGWRVESSEGSEWFPVVFLAAGRFSNPIVPPAEALPGLDSFTGEVIHASDYHGPEPFAGKRVLVVGNGPSGVDISAELPKTAKTPVLLSMRTGIILRPRYPMGMPKHAWMLLADFLPDFIGRWLLKKITDIKFDDTYLNTVGIKTPNFGEESSAAAAGTRGAELINVVSSGNVKVVDAPRLFYGSCVETDTGEKYEIDAVILATGYQPALYHFLDTEYEVGPNGWPKRKSGDENLNPDREVKGNPGLYLIGTFYQGKGALYNCNTESKWAVEQAQERLSTLQKQHDQQLNALSYI